MFKRFGSKMLQKSMSSTLEILEYFWHSEVKLNCVRKYSDPIKCRNFFVNKDNREEDYNFKNNGIVIIL